MGTFDIIGLKQERCSRERPMVKNNLRKYRERLLLSKSELARKAGVSVLTIDRVEKGSRCRMETKRKILLALGLSLDEKGKVFASDEE